MPAVTHGKGLVLQDLPGVHNKTLLAATHRLRGDMLMLPLPPLCGFETQRMVLPGPPAKVWAQNTGKTTQHPLHPAQKARTMQVETTCMQKTSAKAPRRGPNTPPRTYPCHQPHGPAKNDPAQEANQHKARNNHPGTRE